MCDEYTSSVHASRDRMTSTAVLDVPSQAEAKKSKEMEEYMKKRVPERIYLNHEIVSVDHLPSPSLKV